MAYKVSGRANKKQNSFFWKGKPSSTFNFSPSVKLSKKFERNILNDSEVTSSIPFLIKFPDTIQ